MSKLQEIKYVVMIVKNSDGEIYLHHHAEKQTIGFVGGKVDPIVVNGEIVAYEDPIDSACREFKEETGNEIYIARNGYDDYATAHARRCTKKKLAKSRRCAKRQRSTRYPVRIEDCLIMGKAKIFIAQLVGANTLDLQAWRYNEKTLRETAGIYAVKIDDILAYMPDTEDCLRINTREFDGVLPVRDCAKNTFKLLQRYFS